jgi:hypothetical protein
VGVDCVFVHVDCAFVGVYCVFVRLDLMLVRVALVFVRIDCVFVRVALVFGSMGAAVSLPSPGMKTALHSVSSHATSHRQRSNLLYRAAVSLKRPA